MMEEEIELSFTYRQIEMARFAKAISHPARVAILDFLANQNTCVCGDIVGELPLAQSTVSQHLKELMNIGLISKATRNTSSYYCINYDKWEEARRVLGDFFDQFNQKIKCC